MAASELTGNRCETEQEVPKVGVKESKGFEGQGHDGGADVGIATDFGPFFQLGSCASPRLETLDGGSGGLRDVRRAQWVNARDIAVNELAVDQRFEVDPVLAAAGDTLDLCREADVGGKCFDD